MTSGLNLVNNIISSVLGSVLLIYFIILCIPFLILSVYYREKVQLTALSIDLSIYISVYYREKVQLTACKELVASLIKSINILEQG